MPPNLKGFHPLFAMAVINLYVAKGIQHGVKKNGNAPRIPKNFQVLTYTND
jgi:hypothetical protein